MSSEGAELRELAERVPRLHVRTIFDVGANTGQTVRLFRRVWPDASILAFEPVQSTFERLQANVASDTDTRCFRLAFGDQRSRARMSSKPLGTMNRIVADSSPGDVAQEEVEVETGQHFCAGQGISAIDFLKIDAEGFDLKVCRGFEAMLREQKVAILQLEVGLQLHDKRHIPLHEFQTYLDSLGYRLFRIHNQRIDPRRPAGRRGNAIFVSDRTIAENTIEQPRS